MRLIETHLRGCFELQPATYRDQRGSFVKNFHQGQFLELGLETHFPEEFYSQSVTNVLRGLHFTTPPFDQVKIVTCVYGRVLDAVVDLRPASSSYGKYYLTELNDQRCNMIYIDKGMAHGFYVPSGEAVLLYRVSTMHSSQHDSGIRWDSAGIPWPVSNPIISSRDATLPAFESIEKPFALPCTYA